MGVSLKFRFFRASPSPISRLAVSHVDAARTLDNYEIKYKILKIDFRQEFSRNETSHMIFLFLHFAQVFTKLHKSMEEDEW